MRSNSRANKETGRVSLQPMDPHVHTVIDTLVQGMLDERVILIDILLAQLFSEGESEHSLA